MTRLGVETKQGHGKRAVRAAGHVQAQEAGKGVRGMPRLPGMTKDAVSCEKLRGGANDP